MAIEQQEAKAAPKKAAPKKAAPKEEEKPVLDAEQIVDNAINYIKGQTDKKKVFDRTIKKYGDLLTEQQVARIAKFVG
jgi:hypothetical protein